MRYKSRGWFGESHRHSLALARDLNLAILSLPKDEAKSLVRVRSLINK